MHGEFIRTKMMMRLHMQERGSKFHLELYEKEIYITGGLSFKDYDISRFPDVGTILAKFCVPKSGV